MKRIILIIIAIPALIFSSCKKFTDIDPKGKTLLGTVDELEYLLNYDLSSSSAFYLQNLYILDNDTYVPYSSAESVVAGTKNLNYALTTFDASVNRASLVQTDPAYTGLYSIISGRLNVLLATIDQASGDMQKAKQLKAEALVMRAYLHYILVNIYAKAYDPASASSDGGIAYMDKIDYETNPKKSSVAEVYSNILADLNAAQQLGALPNQPASITRVGNAFLYAVKAKVLLSMRNYQEAQTAAEQSLAINNALEDHRPFVATATAERDGLKAPDNLLFAGSTPYLPYFFTATVEVLNNYEPGSIMRNYADAYKYIDGGIDYSIEYGTLYGTKGALAFVAYYYNHNPAGLTVSDTYFVKAECQIRTGKIAEGITALNYIRERRIRTDLYRPVTASTEAAAMALLKKLSRVEFLFTWKNFANIKRWNTEVNYKETITRTISGRTYSLTPESPLWIFPFPRNAADFNPNLTQNY